jgi:DNA-binding transcriptional ArsR family regulator
MRVTTSDPEMDIDQLADLFDALGHGVRLMMIEILREKKSMTLADLRTEVSARYGEITGGNASFHVVSLQRGGLVKVHREGGRDVVTLVRDVKARISKA